MASNKQQRTKKAGTETRLARFIDKLVGAGLDGAVLDNRNDQFYLTGYTGSDAVAVVDARKRLGWLVTDTRYTEEAEQTAPGLETVVWRDGFGSFVGNMVKKRKMNKVGYTPATMTAAFCDAMRASAVKAGEWRDIGSDIADMRSIKDASEVAAIEKAIVCAQEAFVASKRRWKIGMTEVEIKNDLEWEMRKRGAEDAAFETIIAVGANASLPHAHSGGRAIAPGKMLLLDFGARVNRYNSDLTRTLWAGDIPKIWRKRYEKVLEAQRAGIEAIRAGVWGKMPDAKARALFAAAGLADKFTHGLGHGLGLDVHEEPRLSQKSKRRLEAGNIVTVEPGVYFPGSGGIRVEDDVLVEEDGARVLSSLPRDIDSIVF